jgi:chaperonin GroES
MSDALTMLADDQAAPEDADGRIAAADESAQPNRDHAELLKRWIDSPNIADELDDETRARIAMQVLRDYDIDEESRAEWKDKYDKWLRFAMQVTEEKSFPWPRASNVIYPLMTTAAIQFAARAYPAIIKDRDVVKGTIFGSDDGVPLINPATKQQAMGPNGPVWITPPGAKKDRADKIGQHMSWQLLDEQEEWEPQTDMMMTVLPIVGSMFRKSYFDPGMQRNVSETVTALQVCVNYKAKSFETAPRVSEIIDLYPWEVESNIRSGVYLEEEYGANSDAGTDEDALCTFIEQHRRWDLDEDGYAEPYIITVARDSGKLARIKAGYDMEGVFFSKKDHRVRKIDPVKYYTPYTFIPSPDGSPYGIGFGHLLYPLNEAINTTLNQLFDAGTLQNAGGGFVGSNLSMNTGSVRFTIGEYKPVNVSGGNIRDAIFPMPFQGPSAVLFSLLQFLVEAGKEVAAVKDVMVGDLPGDNTSGVATLAMIEQGLKVFSAIYKRIHRSLKSEFKKLFRLNRIYLPEQASYRVGSEWKTVTQQDYKEGAGVEPVSDPQMVTDMQKLGRAQFLLQFKDDPHFDGMAIRKMMLDAALIPGADALLVKQLPPNPEMAFKTADLAHKAAELEFRQHELAVKAAHEEGDLAIRRGKDKAAEIESLTRAILNLANAKKADAEVDQGWAAQQIAFWQARIDALNQGTVNTDDDPATAAGLPGAPAPSGANGGGVPTLAPPPGQQAPLPLPGGLPGPGGPTDAGAMAGG